MKNKVQVPLNQVPQPIPPSGKKQISDKKIINTRNTNMYQQKSGNQQTHTSNINAIENTETTHKMVQGANQQLLSYRSYNNQGQESFRELRDRSYFDESPAVFNPPDENDVDYPISKTRNQEDKHTGSSHLVDNSLQSHLVSVQVYQTESVDSFQNQKFGTSIRTNQILHSIPQSSGHSSVKATDSKSIKSKHLRSKESYKEKESMNQIDSLHHQSANQSDKELLLNSSGVPVLHQIKENEEIIIPPLGESKVYNNNIMMRSNSYV